MFAPRWGIVLLDSVTGCRGHLFIRITVEQLGNRNEFKLVLAAIHSTDHHDRFARR